MNRARGVRRAGPRCGSWLAVPFLLLISAGTLSGQVPDTLPADTVPADPVPPDTIQVPIPPEVTARDTLPTDTAAVDSGVPVPPFPLYDRPGRHGWAFGRWEWDREDLLRYHSLSLLELIERIPGLTAFRLGDFGQPAGVTALGGSGARVRVYLDGFELDPLGFTTPDVQQIALGDLESVRVERRLDGIRIDLTPMRLPDARPLSTVEAATGVYDTKMLRGLLMRGIGRRTTVSAAYDQATSRGFGFRQAFTHSAARASLSYALAPGTALQVEYRGEGSESGANAAPIDAGRRIFVLRGRSEVAPGLTLDAMAGRITRRPEEADPLNVELSSTQGAVRAAYDLGRVWVEGAARLRTDADGVGQPDRALEARAGLAPLPWLLGEAELRSGGVLGASGTRGTATVRAGPLAGLSGFATLGFGRLALPLVRDTTIEEPFEIPEPAPEELRIQPTYSPATSDAAGLRVGADLALPGGSAGLAAVMLPSGTAVPFGHTSFDRGFPAVLVEEARGLEAYASLPVPFTREYLRVEGWYTRWAERGERPYLPEQSGRVALVAHGIFYGGDLEPSLRVEGVHRGSARVANVDAGDFSAVSAPYTFGNVRLEIRIMDLRAFLVFENFTNLRTAADVPGNPLPGARLYYGIHWTFRN